MGEECIWIPYGDALTMVYPHFIDVDEVDGKRVYTLYCEGKWGKQYRVPMHVSNALREEYYSHWRSYTFADFLMSKVWREYSVEEE